jgi:hypothetical protein
MWGAVAVAVALLLLMSAMDILPEGLDDLLSRSWPGLLVLFGLSTMLGNKVVFGRVASAVISVLLVVGIAVLAYSVRTSQVSEAQQYLIMQPVEDNANRLTVYVTMLTTNIELLRSSDSDVIRGEFIGSQQSEILAEYYDDDSADGAVIFELTETKPDSLPPLEYVGRGTLTLELPTGIAVEIVIDSDDGTVNLNATDLWLERLVLNVHNGNAIIALPEYQPALLDAEEAPGAITVSNGSLTVLAPDTIDVQLTFDQRDISVDPQYDSDIYTQEVDGTYRILRRRVEESDIRLFFAITIPRGLLRLQLGSN